jgi:hypothetical protein
MLLNEGTKKIISSSFLPVSSMISSRSSFGLDLPEVFLVNVDPLRLLLLSTEEPPPHSCETSSPRGGNLQAQSGGRGTAEGGVQVKDRLGDQRRGE